MGLSRCARGVLVFASKARCGPIPLRLAYWALRGIGPAFAEEALGKDGAFALCARGFGVRFQGLLRTDPAPLGVWGLRGIGPALAEEARGRIGLSRCARGVLVFASKACCGPIPLRLAYGGLRGIGPALAEEGSGEEGLSRCALGILVFASKARCGPIPLPLGVGWVFWEADVRRLRGGSRGGVVGDGAWLGGVLAVSTVPHGVF
jgi:hypothetical protein